MLNKSIFTKFRIAKELIIEYTKTILFAVLIALIFRSCVFEPYQIPSGSMIPNLLVGDHLFVSKYKYGYSRYSLPFGLPIMEGRIFFKEPKRGDIVIFRPFNNNEVSYVKRLIGLPGDEVQITEGVLYINKVAVARKEVGTYTEIGPHGEHKIYDMYEESLPNGVRYNILRYHEISQDISTAFDPNNTSEYKVPLGYYFFMGDNRDNSQDSRFLDDVGFVAEENLIGRAEVIFFPGDLSFRRLLLHFDKGRLFQGLANAD